MFPRHLPSHDCFRDMACTRYMLLFLPVLALGFLSICQVVADPSLPPPTPKLTPPPSSPRSAPVVENTTSCYRVIAGGGGVEMWQQCGGNTYPGSTTCVSGGECVYVNEHYSSCQPISSAVVRCS
ncbi:hypothetical protein FPV67DRAFT_869289 [Lyophyllum atratum]|nr:hypothetical protein FPV67DRAFT_869289 [Lyophyllum atratum]